MRPACAPPPPRPPPEAAFRLADAARPALDRSRRSGGWPAGAPDTGHYVKSPAHTAYAPEHRDDADIDEARIIDALNRLDAAWHLFIDKTQAHLVLSLVDRVTLQPDGMVIRWNLAGLARLVR